jgi:hypothetical protein
MIGQIVGIAAGARPNPIPYPRMRTPHRAPNMACFMMPGGTSCPDAVAAYDRLRASG